MLLHLDHVDDVEMEEDKGIIVSLKRKARFTGVPGTDFSELFNVLQTVGLPLAGSTLVPIAQRASSPYGMLVLIKRTPKIVDKDSGCVDVMLDYQNFMDHNNQQFPILNQPASANWFAQKQYGIITLYGKSKTSVQQTKTNFYIPDRIPLVTPPLFIIGTTYATGTIVDYNGFYWKALGAGGIVVASAYPAVGPLWSIATVGQAGFASKANTTGLKRQVAVGHTFPGTEEASLANKTFFQTGEITIMQPQETYTVGGFTFTPEPWNIASSIIGKVNDSGWMNHSSDEWMCMEVEWEAIFVGAQYKMRFQFQHNPDTWQPTAIFADQRTGKPPVNIVDGFGRVTVPYHGRLNFNNFFASTFENPAGT